ncbi:MAG TPA: hypothetical protein VNW46_17850 [Gemmatimonadaceae bacterium]|nr:hypothetical protein [Gemmatimonadaceae bacterium]
MSAKALWSGLVVMAFAVATGSAGAQGNVSTLGQGYPPGQLSTRDMGSGGAFGEIDAESPLNPAALSAWGSIGLHFQYDPEFRTVTANGVTEHTTTNRFPLFIGAIPISHFTLGLSFSTLLDRTWETNVTQTLAPQIGDVGLPSTETTTFRSTGGISDLRLGVAWSATPWLAVGAGVDWFTGQNQILQQVTFSDTTPGRFFPSVNNSTISYGGIGASAGIILRPIHSLALAGSFRVGGNVRAREGDSTTLANGNIPARAGGQIAFTGIPGVSLGARVDWEQWSKLNDLSVGDVTAKDGLGWSVGTDVQAFSLFGRTIQLRLGGGRRALPYVVAGTQINETDLSGGVGIPFGRGRVTLDISVVRDWRTSVVGVTESAYITSTGLTIHP